MITFLRDFLRVLNTPCRAQTELISRTLDAPLAPLSRGERVGLWIHLRGCRACTQFRRQLLKLHQLAASINPSGTDSTMPADVKDRLRSATK
jgi:hypothetical protein